MSRLMVNNVREAELCVLSELPNTEMCCLCINLLYIEFSNIVNNYQDSRQTIVMSKVGAVDSDNAILRYMFFHLASCSSYY